MMRCAMKRRSSSSTWDGGADRDLSWSYYCHAWVMSITRVKVKVRYEMKTLTDDAVINECCMMRCATEDAIQSWDSNWHFGGVDRDLSDGDRSVIASDCHGWVMPIARVKVQGIIGGCCHQQQIQCEMA